MAYGSEDALDAAPIGAEALNADAVGAVICAGWLTPKADGWPNAATGGFGPNDCPKAEVGCEGWPKAGAVWEGWPNAELG